MELERMEQNIWLQLLRNVEASILLISVINVSNMMLCRVNQLISDSNKIGDKGAESIVAAIEISKSMRHIDLSIIIIPLQ